MVIIPEEHCRAWTRGQFDGPGGALAVWHKEVWALRGACNFEMLDKEPDWGDNVAYLFQKEHEWLQRGCLPRDHN